MKTWGGGGSLPPPLSNVCKGKLGADDARKTGSLNPEGGGGRRVFKSTKFNVRGGGS